MMRVVNVCPTDVGGGAERVARMLHDYLLAQGHSASRLACGTFFEDVEGAYLIDNDSRRSFPAKAAAKLAPKVKRAHQTLSPAQVLTRRTLTALGSPKRTIDTLSGKMDLHFPGTYSIVHDTKPDILQLHNLHGNYFDFRALPALSAKQPTVFTAHDTWMVSGHCAYFLKCEKWKDDTECKPCPHLEYPPALLRDNAHYNFKLKKMVFELMHDRIHLVAPATWVTRQLEASIMAPAIASITHIPNGVDQDIFMPVDTETKKALRNSLDIPTNAFTLVYSLASINNPYKDVETLTRALEDVASHSSQELCFIILGGHAKREVCGNLTEISIPFNPNPNAIARYLQASDLYVHAARAEVHPLAILEAQSCGIPAVVSETGGTAETINVGKSGLLFEQENFRALSKAVLEIINNPELHASMAAESIAYARPRFSSERMGKDYVDLYYRLLDEKK